MTKSEITCTDKIFYTKSATCEQVQWPYLQSSLRSSDRIFSFLAVDASPDMLKRNSIYGRDTLTQANLSPATKYWPQIYSNGLIKDRIIPPLVLLFRGFSVIYQNWIVTTDDLHFLFCCTPSLHSLQRHNSQYDSTHQNTRGPKVHAELLNIV